MGAKLDPSRKKSLRTCRQKRIEVRLARRALHRSLPRNRESPARGSVGKAARRRHVAQPTAHEGRVEAVAGAGRVDFLNLKSGLRQTRRGVEIAGTFRAPLVDDGADASSEDLGDGGALLLGGREQGEFGTARQEEVASTEQLFAGLAKAWQVQHLWPKIWVERNRAAARLHHLGGLEDDVDDPRREQGSPHDVQMIAAVENGARRGVELDAPRRALSDIVYKGAGAVCAVAHEGAACHGLGVDSDAADIDPVAMEAVEIDTAEVVVADAADHGGGLAEAGGLVDEDRRRARGKGTDELDRLEEAVPSLGRHDLDQNL